MMQTSPTRLWMRHRLPVSWCLALGLLACGAGTDRPYNGRTAIQWSDRLRDSSVAVRIEAAEALYQIAPRSDRVVGALLAAMADTNSAVESAVAIALGRVGGPAVPGLIEATRDEHPGIRTLAMSILASQPDVDSAVVPIIALGLVDIEPEVRLHAAQVLGGMGAAAATAAPALLAAVRVNEGVTKAAALQAAAFVGADVRVLHRIADSAMTDTSAAVRHAALRSRITGPSSAAEQMAVAQRLLADSDVGVRASAHRALTRAVRDAATAAEARRLLAPGSADPSELVRTAVRDALAPPERVRDPDARYRRQSP